MTVKDAARGTADLERLVASDPDLVRSLMRAAPQEVLEGEKTETVGAAKGGRTEEWLGYRAGYYGRTLVTQVGKLELRGRERRSRPGSRRALLDRAVRALPALRAGLGRCPGRDVRVGGSTRKVKAITEELCGHRFSASSISALNQRLDASLAQLAGRRIEEPYPI